MEINKKLIKKALDVIGAQRYFLKLKKKGGGRICTSTIYMEERLVELRVARMGVNKIIKFMDTVKKCDVTKMSEEQIIEWLVTGVFKKCLEDVIAENIYSVSVFILKQRKERNMYMLCKAQSVVQHSFSYCC